MEDVPDRRSTQLAAFRKLEIARDQVPDQTIEPISRTGLIVSVVAVLVAFSVSLFWLVHTWDPRSTNWDSVIRTSLTAAASIAGGAALLLAFRRQRSAEIQAKISPDHQLYTAESTRHDAAERRITELFGRAVDHLGNDSAIIRTAGVYALERLAQNEESQRAMIVATLCAYLRSPFPPYDSHPDLQEEIECGNQIELAQERRLRRPILDLLGRHSRYYDTPESDRPPKDYWPGMELDLRWAALFDLNFSMAKIKQLDCRNCVSHGLFQIRGARVEESSDFGDSTFCGAAELVSTVFNRGASFQGVEFRSTAQFQGVHFIDGAANFTRVRFLQNFNFSEAKFRGRVSMPTLSLTYPPGLSEGRPHATGQVSIAVEPLFEGASIEAKSSLMSTLPQGWHFAESIDGADVCVIERDEKLPDTPA